MRCVGGKTNIWKHTHTKKKYLGQMFALVRMVAVACGSCHTVALLGGVGVGDGRG